MPSRAGVFSETGREGVVVAVLIYNTNEPLSLHIIESYISLNSTVPSRVILELYTLLLLLLEHPPPFPPKKKCITETPQATTWWRGKIQLWAKDSTAQRDYAFEAISVCVTNTKKIDAYQLSLILSPG